MAHIPTPILPSAAQITIPILKTAAWLSKNSSNRCVNPNTKLSSSCTTPYATPFKSFDIPQTNPPNSQATANRLPTAA